MESLMEREFSPQSRVRGKAGTEYEGKEGIATHTEWLNNPESKTVRVIWDGETEEIFVNSYDLDILEIMG